MGFFSKWKKPNSDAAEPGIAISPDHLAADRQAGELTEDLYKRNVELSTKNKTLSLLRELYQISLLTLEPKELGEKITHTVRAKLEFDMVGIFLYDSAKRELQTLKIDESDKLKELRTEHGLVEEPVIAPADCAFLLPIIEKKVLNHAYGLADLWTIKGKHAIPFELQKDSYIKATVGYPLMIEDRIIGVLVVSFNREYESMLSYEKESIASLVDVTAVALDKSRLYKELEAMNSQLTVANKSLRELDQAKSEFISLATHQIRSPLTAIKGYSSLILEGDYGKISDELRGVVKIIFDSCQSLVVIVNEFLDISRIEQGRMKYNRERLDLLVLAKDTIQELLPNINHAGLSMELVHGKEGEYPVFADRGKTKQVISNLIDNAVKYTREGGITVRLMNEAHKVRLIVKDTGLGIEKDELPKLFGKFIRAHEAHKMNVTGTGLGLYIVKQMIEAQGGTVSVFSEGKGKGTTFTVELPEAVAE